MQRLVLLVRLHAFQVPQIELHVVLLPLYLVLNLNDVSAGRRSVVLLLLECLLQIILQLRHVVVLVLLLSLAAFTAATVRLPYVLAVFPVLVDDHLGYILIQLLDLGLLFSLGVDLARVEEIRLIVSTTIADHDLAVRLLILVLRNNGVGVPLLLFWQQRVAPLVHRYEFRIVARPLCLQQVRVFEQAFG